MVQRTLFVAAIALLAVAGCTGNGDADLVVVAESFRAPAGWTDTGQDRGSEPVCFGPDCEVIVLRWRSPVPPTAAQLSDAAGAAGWSDIEVDKCTPRDNVTGPVPFCELTASDDDAEITLRVAGPVADDPPWEITLQVA